MNIQSIINSRYGVGLALGLGRSLHPGVGYRLANRVTDLIASQKQLHMVQVARANQWVVSGGTLAGRMLDQQTRRTFEHTGRCIYDLYHNLDSRKKILSLVRFPPEMETFIDDYLHGKRVSTVFASLHLSNFDLLGHALGIRGLKMQILSFPQPSGGYRLQNRLREDVGLDVTPISMTALRSAVNRLEAGEIVLTGAERPVAGAKYKVTFFGRQASMPVAHVRLAVKAKIPVTLVAGRMQPDGTYRLLMSEPIPMKMYTDLDKETVTNAEAVLRVAEEWIKQNPEQWSMYFSVWPETVKEVRGL